MPSRLQQSQRRSSRERSPSGGSTEADGRDAWEPARSRAGTALIKYMVTVIQSHVLAIGSVQRRGPVEVRNGNSHRGHFPAFQSPFSNNTTVSASKNGKVLEQAEFRPNRGNSFGPVREHKGQAYRQNPCSAQSSRLGQGFFCRKTTVTARVGQPRPRIQCGVDGYCINTHPFFALFFSSFLLFSSIPILRLQNAPHAGAKGPHCGLDGRCGAGACWPGEYEYA